MTYEKAPAPVDAELRTPASSLPTRKQDNLTVQRRRLCSKVTAGF
jgi:hypothetical protein